MMAKITSNYSYSLRKSVILKNKKGVHPPPGRNCFWKNEDRKKFGVWSKGVGSKDLKNQKNQKN